MWWGHGSLDSFLRGVTFRQLRAWTRFLCASKFVEVSKNIRKLLSGHPRIHRSRYPTNRFLPIRCSFFLGSFGRFDRFGVLPPPGPGTRARYEIKYLAPVILYNLLYKISYEVFCELVKLRARGNCCPLFFIFAAWGIFNLQNFPWQ